MPVRERIRAATSDGADAGFTLVEVLVALTLFVTVAVGAALGVTRSVDASRTTQQRVDASNVAQAFIARAISEANTIAPEAGKTVVSVVGDGAVAAQEQFTVTRWITFDSGGDTCHPGTVFSVSVEVRQTQTNAFLARSDSKVACPPA